jgi:hypothetical protein
MAGKWIMMAVGALALLLGCTGSPSPVQQEAINPAHCPGGAIGYVRVVKDGYRVAGGSGSYDPQSDVVTASFPLKGRKQVVLTLKLIPFSLHTLGVGAVKIKRGTFCAYPLP